METGSFSLQNLNLDLLPGSLAREGEVEFGMARVSGELRLVLLADPGDERLSFFEGETSNVGDRSFLVGPTSGRNADALRRSISWLRPCLIGLRTSAGLGDRIGLATPGHVRAVRKVGGSIAPIFAQQSVRENTRTGRNPQQVLDDATWGVFQEGWLEGYGADADHLKTTDDIDSCLAAGYTLYTIDPGEYVDNRAEAASSGELQELAAALPRELQPKATGLLGTTLCIERLKIPFDEPTLLKAVVKYGRAIGHVAAMYRYLTAKANGYPFELEVSVDETDQPTRHAEHAYIASELKRQDVHWVSLAPRYIGAFEKGVDYIGDVSAFEADIAGHAAIARHFGCYKLSLHSGSDKFSIYPAAVRQTHGLIHLKTAGTSYLEALRTIADADPDLLVEIYRFARQRFEIDRASYHVSARLERAPLPEQISNWRALLDQFDARQILHHTYGSVLTARTDDGKPLFYDRMITLLKTNADAYAENLEKHFIHHLTPFARQSDWKF